MRGREGGVRGIGTGFHGSWAGLAALLAAGAAQAHHPGSHAARQAAALGIRIYTITVGRPGTSLIRIPNEFGGEQLARITNEFDPETMKKIADR